MNLILEVSDIKRKNIFLCDPIKNTVMDNSNFIRVLYSNPLITLNSIYIKFNIIPNSVEKYFNKYKCSFDIEKNKPIISELCRLEDDIISLIKTTKESIKKITHQLKSGNIKIFSENVISSKHDEYILKISGIWETDKQFGITFKFMDINSPTLIYPSVV